MALMLKTKTCEYCGQRYPRPANYSAKQWELRRFCNHKCQGDFYREDPRERFKRFFDRGDPDTCWEWKGGRHSKGYGQFGNPTDKAHRVAWEFYRGPIPDGIHVLHACDNPPCVNPNHLFLGTNLDNVKDKMAKGRGHTVRGTDAGTNILSEEAVRQIRTDQRKQDVIAAEYGVAQTTVSAIKRRINWAWLE
jgi:hypothetical protein